MADKQWEGTTYGSSWMHRTLIRILRLCDVRLLYVFSAVFVIPVCLVGRPGGGIIYRYFRHGNMVVPGNRYREREGRALDGKFGNRPAA